MGYLYRFVLCLCWLVLCLCRFVLCLTSGRADFHFLARLTGTGRQLPLLNNFDKHRPHNVAPTSESSWGPRQWRILTITSVKPPLLDTTLVTHGITEPALVYFRLSQRRRRPH